MDSREENALRNRSKIEKLEKENAELLLKIGKLRPEKAKEILTRVDSAIKVLEAIKKELVG